MEKINVKEKARSIRSFLLDMIADAKKECREFTEEEQQLFDEQKNELLALSEQIKNTEDKLDEIESALPEVEEKSDEEEKPDEEPEKPAEEPAEEPAAEQTEPETPAAEEEPAADEEKKSDEDEKPADDQTSEEPEKPAEEPEKPEDDSEINKDESSDEDKKKIEQNAKRKTNNIMNFSLLKAIRAAADGKQFDPMTEAVIAEAQKDFRGANLETGANSIILPGEKRTITITNEHDEVVKEDWEPLLLPLFKNKVLGKARRLSGLKNDIRVPKVSSVDCAWEGEITENQETTATFDHVVMKPHRISATIYLSKNFLIQESLGAEQVLRNLLIEAMEQKLESTFLGKAAASTAGGKNIPAGLLYGKTATPVTDFAKMCDFEATAVSNNYNLGSMEYVLDPKSWAKIRSSFVYGGKTNRMVMEGNEIDGRPYSISQNLAQNELILANFSDIYLGQWAGTELSVDTTSVGMARTAQVAVTLNAWFDCIAVRPESIQLGTVVAGNNPG